MGRRESKRRETHDALIASATRLFTERGYQATTIADIAAGAGVAPRTFFGYFPTKEAVLFWPFDVLAANLEEALSEGPDDALTTLRTGLTPIPHGLTRTFASCESSSRPRPRRITPWR